MGDRLKKLETQMAALMSRLPKAQPPKQRPKRKRRKRAGPGLALGELRLSKMELVSSVGVKANVPSNKGALKLVASELPFLKTICNSFERLQFLKVRVVYKPLCGTVRDGGVTMGIDWNFDAPADTRAKIACYTPTQSGPVFKEFSMTLPPGRLASRRYYMTSATGFDGGPGIVCWAIDAASKEDFVFGEIWVAYEVILSGTRS